MSQTRRAICDWDAAVDHEAARLIERGVPPYCAVERAVQIVSDQRRRAATSPQPIDAEGQPKASTRHCQHDVMKPGPTLRPTYPRHDSSGGWIQEYRCNVCGGKFELPMATASTQLTAIDAEGQEKQP